MLRSGVAQGHPYQGLVALGQLQPGPQRRVGEGGHGPHQKAGAQSQPGGGQQHVLRRAGYIGHVEALLIQAAGGGEHHQGRRAVERVIALLGGQVLQEGHAGAGHARHRRRVHRLELLRPRKDAHVEPAEDGGLVARPEHGLQLLPLHRPVSVGTDAPPDLNRLLYFHFKIPLSFSGPCGYHYRQRRKKYKYAIFL